MEKEKLHKYNKLNNEIQHNHLNDFYKNKNTNKKCFKLFIFFTILIISIAIGYILANIVINVLYSTESDKSTTSKQKCITKLDIITTSNNVKLYNFNNSLEICRRSKGYDLFYIRSESDLLNVKRILDILPQYHNRKFWINGHVDVQCNDSEENCKRNALAGKGVPISFQNQSSMYSRLAQKINGNDCITFKYNEDLWESVNCSDLYQSICVQFQ